MLENCKRLICSPSLNKVYCIVLYCIVKCGANLKKSTKTLTGGGSSHSPLIVPYSNSYCVISSLLKLKFAFL